MTRFPQPTRKPQERAIVCGARGPGCAADESIGLEEARGLVLAAGADVVGIELTQRRARPDPATLFGSGKVAEIRAEVERVRPDLVVVDNDLSPAQSRNLEKAWEVRVVDRSELILDIFAKRAMTRQARLQVELAQSEYLAPRLRRMWTHLERMEGAIGTRGPGETQLETDKRLLRRRIQDLREELEEIEQRRQREVRSRSDLFTVGLVGYTNAGKSTLLNQLTGSAEFVADMLFATLDTRTRQWRLADGRRVLLSDTVGFLQRLPHHLVACFHATLEEALHSDLLLHVVDASHSDAPMQMEAVEQVLGTLSHDVRETIVVLNKIDRVPDPIVIPTLAARLEGTYVCLSAATGEGVSDLERCVARSLDAKSVVIDVVHPVAEGGVEASVRKFCAPMLDELDPERGVRRIRVSVTPGQLGVLRHQVTPKARIEIVDDPSRALEGS